MITGEKLDEMKVIKNTYLDSKEYSKRVIYDNYVLEAVDSTLPNAREHCSDLGQGFDVIFARFGELDWVRFLFIHGFAYKLISAYIHFKTSMFPLYRTYSSSQPIT